MKKMSKMWLAVLLVMSMAAGLFVPMNVAAKESPEYEVHEFKIGKFRYTDEPDDIQYVITSFEELQEFVNGDLKTYCDNIEYVDEEAYGEMQLHLQSLDETFFEENVYVATISGKFTHWTSLHVERFTDIDKPEDGLYGKCLIIQYGDGFTVQPAMPGSIFGGVAIPRADLEGKEIVQVIVTDERIIDPTEEPTLAPTETPEPTETPKRIWSGNFQYEIIDFKGYNAVKIVSYKSTEEENNQVEIPAKIDDMWVRTIGESAFHGISGLESIIIPNRVTTIEDGAFEEETDTPVIICGYTYSEAYEYAMAKGLPFSSLGKNMPEGEQQNFVKIWGNARPGYYLEANDALTILQYCVGLIENIDLELADANQSGAIEAEDALYVLECVVGLKEVTAKTPTAYEVYNIGFGVSDLSPFFEETLVELPATFSKVFHSTEEVQTFLEGDFAEYGNLMTEYRTRMFKNACVLLKSLDEDFFEDNVFVITITDEFNGDADFYADCLINIVENGVLIGKKFKIVYGSLYDDMYLQPSMPLGEFSGTVIPKKDLERVDIVEVELVVNRGF